MLRVYCLVLAVILTNSLTYLFTIRSKETNLSDKEVSESFAISKPQNHANSESLEVAEVHFETNAHVYKVYDLAYVGDVILGLEPSNVRTSLLQVLTAGWFERDPTSLAEWLNQKPEEVDVDQTIAVFSRLAGNLDPETSLEWAISISNNQLRDKTVQEVASQFRSSYTEQFYEYMASGGLGPRAVASVGVATIPSPGGAVVDGEAPIRIDIIEEESESIESILARRTRIAGPSSRVNNVQLTQE